jgi:SH3-like domain-containing protein
MEHRKRTAIVALFVLALAICLSLIVAARQAEAQSAQTPQDSELDLSTATLYLKDLPPGFQDLSQAEVKDQLESAVDIYRSMMSGQTQAELVNVTGFRSRDALNQQFVVAGLETPLSPWEQTQIDRAFGYPGIVIQALRKTVGGDETGELPGYKTIGTTSLGFTMTTGGYRLNYVVARRGPVLIEVALLYDTDQAPLVDIVALARLLDERLLPVVGPETLQFRSSGPFVPELTTYIPTPLDVSTRPEVIGANLLLAALLMLLFSIAVELFSRALADSEGSLPEKLSGLPWLQQLRARLPVPKAGTRRRLPLMGVVRAAGVMLFYGLVFSLLDKTWNPLSMQGLVLFGSMTLAYGVVGLLGDLRAWRAIRRWGLSAGLNLRPTNILLSLVSTATTRLLSLAPGLMFGTPQALQTDEGQFDDRQQDRLTRIGVGTSESVALLAWLPTIVTTILQRLEIADNVKTIVGGLEAFLLVLFAVALENLFVQMLGFPGSFGESLHRRHRWQWLLGLFLVTFGFYHTLINPRGELAEALQGANVRLFFGVAMAFVVIAFGLYVYTLRERKTQKAIATAAPPGVRAAVVGESSSVEQAVAPPVPVEEISSTSVSLSPGETKVCPACGETIQAEARICRFCRQEVGSAVDVPKAVSTPVAEPRRQKRHSLLWLLGGVAAVVVLAAIAGLLWTGGGRLPAVPGLPASQAPTSLPPETPSSAPTAMSQETTTATAVLSASATPVPDAAVRENSIELREGPSSVYAVVRTYVQGTQLEVLGRSAGKQWLKVRAPDGQVGWTRTEYLQVNISVDDLEVATAAPSPTPKGQQVQPTAPPSIRRSVVVTLVRCAYSQWGRPAGMDDPSQACGYFDDRHPVLKVDIELHIENNSSADMKQWSATVYKKGGARAYTCYFGYEGVSGIPVVPAGQSREITLAAFIELGESLDYAVVVHSTGAVSNRVTLPPQ